MTRSRAFAILGIEETAMEREMCDAFEDHVRELTSSSQWGPRLLERIGQVHRAAQMMDITEDLDAEDLEVVIYWKILTFCETPKRTKRTFNKLLLALDTLLGWTEDLFDESTFAQHDVRSAAVHLINFSSQEIPQYMRQFLGYPEDSKPGRYSPPYAKVCETRGSDYRGTDCNICHEDIDEGAPTVTQETCMNTFCKDDWGAWVKHNPTCPSCRGQLRRQPLALLLRSREFKKEIKKEFEEAGI
jgi:hypothetical protein